MKLAKTLCLRRSPIRGFFVLFCFCASASAQSFSPFQGLVHSMEQINLGSTALGDFDGDGDFDILLFGISQNGIRSGTYRFDGYQEIPRPQQTPLVSIQSGLPQTLGNTGAAYSAVGWTDLNGDGLVDFFVTGSVTSEPPYEPRGSFFGNTGAAGNRYHYIFMTAEATHSGSVAWADYDNDGDEDLLITGVSGEDYITTLYRTDRNPVLNVGDFSNVRLVEIETSLPGIGYGEGIWGDFDNDGDFDVLLAGSSASGFITEIFRNDGGAFSPINANMLGLINSDVDWGDYDNDGDIDLLLSGALPGLEIAQGFTKVYRNDGGIFTDIGLDVPGTFSGGNAWGDFDGDGYLDILLLGIEKMLDREKVARLYRNLGNGSFESVPSLIVAGMALGALALGDMDEDHDLDFITVGYVFGPQTIPYRNEYNHRNLPPQPPTHLQTTENGDGSVTISWSDAVDAETPSAGLTYNIRVGVRPGGSEIASPMAHPFDGHRRIAAPGNVGPNTSWTFQNVSPGTYYWSVQAIDHGYIGSAFADEIEVTITEPGGLTQASTGAK